MADVTAEKALAKAARRERLNRAELTALIAEITPDSLQAVGESAHANRTARYGRAATYVFNLQVNPSNVCKGSCEFCRFAVRSLTDQGGYSLNEDDILARIERLTPTEVHMTGGLNDLWPYARCLEFVRILRRRAPALHIKAFDAVEIDYFARTAGKRSEEILAELLSAGVNALPGGGAEIFSDRLRQRYWPEKIGPERWLEIHEQAHRLGLPTNATMLFGIGDTWAERVEHMLRLRDSQERAPGYQCFIPLAFQPGSDSAGAESPTPFDTLRVLALARIALDNIPHLKSYWPSLGEATAAAGLGYGADDMDGTLSEERIMHAAGSTTPLGLARRHMIEIITLAGFEPVERDGTFACKPAPTPCHAAGRKAGAETKDGGHRVHRGRTISIGPHP